MVLDLTELKQAVEKYYRWLRHACILFCFSLNKNIVIVYTREIICLQLSTRFHTDYL